jgi:hypothetical protein
MLDEQAGSSSSSDSGKGGGEVRPFGNRIYYHHYRVMTRGFGELNYEVHADGVPRGVWDRERVELTNQVMPLGFSPKAHVTSGDVLPDVPGHLRPPVTS